MAVQLAYLSLLVREKFKSSFVLMVQIVQLATGSYIFNPTLITDSLMLSSTSPVVDLHSHTNQWWSLTIARWSQVPAWEWNSKSEWWTYKFLWHCHVNHCYTSNSCKMVQLWVPVLTLFYSISTFGSSSIILKNHSHN